MNLSCDFMNCLIKTAVSGKCKEKATELPKKVTP